MIEQLHNLVIDASRILNGRRWRLLALPFSQAFAMVSLYRIERGCWLSLGRAWIGLRVLLLPVLALIRPWAGSELHYRADIGPGLMILHPSLGVVVSGSTVAGNDLVLTGGNVIGTRRGGTRSGHITIGDSVNLGSHAAVLGPVTIGDRVFVGANSVVVHDVDSDSTVVGAPARPIS